MVNCKAEKYSNLQYKFDPNEFHSNKFNPVDLKESPAAAETPYIDGLVQDCSIYIANVLEILQFCCKPWIYSGPIMGL